MTWAARSPTCPGADERRPLPGEAHTDAHEAFFIADAVRVMPHTLRSVRLGDEAIVELEMIVGFDDDLAGKATRISNHPRGLTTQTHPGTNPRPAHPAPGLPKVLTSMPGIGIRTGARSLIEVGDGSSFPSAVHPVAFAGPAPTIPSSGIVNPRRTKARMQSGPAHRPKWAGSRFPRTGKVAAVRPGIRPCGAVSARPVEKPGIEMA